MFMANAASCSTSSSRAESTTVRGRLVRLVDGARRDAGSRRLPRRSRRTVQSAVSALSRDPWSREVRHLSRVLGASPGRMPSLRFRTAPCRSSPAQSGVVNSTGPTFLVPENVGPVEFTTCSRSTTISAVRGAASLGGRQAGYLWCLVCLPVLKFVTLGSSFSRSACSALSRRSSRK